MIFTDSGAIYAIFDKNDSNHLKASLFFKNNIKKDKFLIITPVLVECWFLIESRLGNYYSQKFLDSVNKNIFLLKETDYMDFINALKIIEKFSDSKIGLVDALSFSYIERNKINNAFTFDKKHYFLYKNKSIKELKILPE